MGKKYSVYAFDFDGTLTTKDSFFAFLAYSAGYAKLTLYILRLIPSILALLFHKASLQETKEKLFASCFKGMSLEEFDKRCSAFAQANAAILRAQGMTYIEQISKEHEVLIVSASIKNYISFFFKDKKLSIEATIPEVDSSGKLTGKFCGANCKGSEKVRRIEKHFPKREEYTLIAFGDSSGDRKMFDFADETHWKPFRS